MKSNGVMIGKTISHYRVLQKLGEGGMGVVYLAEDTRLGRQVALKFSTAAASDPGLRARLLREARAASAISHPSIAAVYDYGESADGSPFIAMELVRGEDLAHRLRRGPLALDESVRIAAAVARALAEAHRYGIVHRDIKPANVVVDERGHVKVLDFGLAKEIATGAAAGAATMSTLISPTRQGTVVGTPFYMSPEQARQGTVGPASDLFSLGAMLYECLATKPPFSGATSVEVLGEVLHVTPPPPSTYNPSVPPELDAIAMKALAKDAADRYPDAEQMASDLEAVLASWTGAQSAPSRVSIYSTPPQKPARRRVHAYGIAAGILLAAVLAGSAWWLLQPGYRAAPEALRWYDEGLAALRDGTYYKASMALQRAVTRDPAFPMAHARLAEAWLELDYADKAREELLRVSPAGGSPRVNRLDRLVVEALRATLTTNFAEAVAKHREIVSGTPEIGKANAYVDLGRAYEKNEKPQEALKSYQEAARRSPQEPAAWLRLGNLYGRQADQAKAAAAFDQAESLYRGLSNVEGSTEVLYQRAVLANRSGGAIDARPLLEKAAEMARASGNLYQQVLILIQLSSTSLRRNEVERSQREAAEAVDLARANGLENLTTRGLIELGNAYFIRGEYDEAARLFTQALEYARRYHSGRSEARALFSLGSLQIQRGVRDEGLRNVEQAQSWFERGGYLKEASLALILIGRTRRTRGEYDAALASFQQQLQLARKLQDNDQVALSLEGVASVLDAQERWPEALASYRDAGEMSKQPGHSRNAPYHVLGAAGALWQLGRYAEARQALDQLGGGTSADLVRQVAWMRVRIDVSQRLFPAAIAGARRLLAQPGLTPEMAAEVKISLGEALASSGASRDAVAATREALAFAANSANPGLLAEARLAHANASLAAGDDREALRESVEAQQWFEKVGRAASEWRSWLVGARAAARTGDSQKSREDAEKASAALARLASRWDAESYQTYSSRPDVQFDRAQLVRLSPSK